VARDRNPLEWPLDKVQCWKTKAKKGRFKAARDTGVEGEIAVTKNGNFLTVAGRKACHLIEWAMLETISGIAQRQT
jgi:hypothetical protein